VRVPWASILNAVVCAVGGILGVVFGHRLPERIRTAVLGGIGLVTLVVGVRSALGTTNIVIPLLALALGALIGEAFRIEARLEGLGERLRERFAKHDKGRFVEGFVTATLIATVGPLTILGSLAEGAHGDRELILIKTALDGFMTLSVAAAYGIGVAFSAIGVLAVQVPITLVGSLAGGDIDGRVLAEIEATGGLIIMAIGLRLLDIKKLPIASYLPGLLLAPAILWIGERIVN
jgi:uncharacterized membrane protein YqgA involved in biofilm formation